MGIPSPPKRSRRHRERGALRTRPAEYAEVPFRVAGLNPEKCTCSANIFPELGLDVAFALRKSDGSLKMGGLNKHLPCPVFAGQGFFYEVSHRAK